MRKEFMLNLSALVADYVTTVGWLPLALGISINVALTYGIARIYMAQVAGLKDRIMDLELLVERGARVDTDFVSHAELRNEIRQMAEIAGEMQADIDSAREGITSQIVSKVCASQEIVIARMTEALKPIDVWRAKNDLEFTRLLENWDELRRFAEDEIIDLKGQVTMCFERSDACKDAAVEAKRMSHETQIMLEGVADSLSERISAFQKEAISDKPKAKKKPAKTKGKKNG